MEQYITSMNIEPMMYVAHGIHHHLNLYWTLSWPMSVCHIKTFNMSLSNGMIKFNVLRNHITQTK